MTEEEITHLKYLLESEFRLLHIPSIASLGFDGARVKKVVEGQAVPIDDGVPEDSECAVLAKSPHYVNLGNADVFDFVVMLYLDEIGKKENE